MPGLGAFAITTNVRFAGDESGTVAGGFHKRSGRRDSRRPRRSRSSMPKIIAHDPTEDEPRRSNRAPHRTADLRFSDARIVAHRHFNDAESPERTFQDYFHRPAVRVSSRSSARSTSARPARNGPRSLILHAVQKPDQASREAIAERRCQGSAPGMLCSPRREPSVMSARPSMIGARRSGSSAGRSL